VVLVAALSATAAVFAAGAPTAIPVVDAVVRGALAAGVTLGASQARRWTWAAAAGAMTIGSAPDQALFIGALAVFAIAVATTVFDIRSRVIGALIGAATVQIALRLPQWGPTGTSAVLGAFACAVLIVSGTRNLRRRTRRRILVGAVVVAGFAIACTAAFSVSVLLARSDALAGADAARAGIEAARQGDTELAIAHFEDALERLRAAESLLDQPWSRVARIVPMVGQNERAVRRLVSNAVDLAETGAFAARSADVESLRAVNGRIDPVAIVALDAPLSDVHVALDRSRRDLRGLGSPWLAWLVDRELDDLRQSLRDASHDARTALLATRAGPTLLGADGPKRYFVMFTTPTEARASGGGFMGNWGVITATDGRLDLTQFGRTEDLNRGGGPLPRHIDGPPDYLARYSRFGVSGEWRNVNMSPDFPTVAEVVAELYPQSGGEPIDGVIAIDPKGLARLLRLTGPVTVTGLPEPLSADNAARILLRDQYLVFPDTAERTDFLEGAARAVTERFTTSSLPGPRTVGRTLGPAVAKGHFFFVSFDGGGNRLLERLGVTGHLGATRGDTFALVTQNASASKLELFLHRTVELTTEIDPAAGRQRTVASIRLRNDAPPQGLPGYVIGNALGLPAGTSRLYVSLYTPLGVARATLDGQPVGVHGEVEQGLNVYSRFVAIPPGAEVVLQVDLRGPMRLVTRHGKPQYRLHVWRQTMVNPDSFAESVAVSGGWKPEEPAGGFETSGNSATYAGRLTADRVLRFTVGG
jgi:hypothetical protein